jgi:hypothetical protein
LLLLLGDLGHRAVCHVRKIFGWQQPMTPRDVHNQRAATFYL